MEVVPRRTPCRPAEMKSSVRIGDGPPGLGKCLYTTVPSIRRGEVVLEETPLLRGDPVHEETLP